MRHFCGLPETLVMTLRRVKLNDSVPYISSLLTSTIGIYSSTNNTSYIMITYESCHIKVKCFNFGNDLLVLVILIRTLLQCDLLIVIKISLNLFS